MKAWATATEPATVLPSSVAYLRTSIVSKPHKWNSSLAGIVSALQYVATR